jgi:GNAT superfamily N-acetyltransferase
MGTETRIRAADAGEQPRLRAIAVAAKGHWGYPPAMVEGWADRDLTAEALSAKRLFVAEVDGTAVGWASLVSDGDVCVLDDLWIDPDWMGQGIGTDLFARAAEQAAAAGARRLEWEAEPNASGFYAKVGGRYLRDSEPSVFGRVLAVMGVDL